MERLYHLQHEFQNYLLGNPATIDSAIADAPPIDTAARLSIYSHAYSARLIEVLELDFPGLHTLLGEDGFDQMAQAYLKAFPSKNRSVRGFPEQMPFFLSKVQPYSEYPVLAEMAAFEWAFEHVLDAADAAKISVHQIEKIPPEEWGYMRFQWHPAVQRLNLKWNVVSIWQAVEEGKEAPEPQASESPIPWLLWRSEDLQVFFQSLSVEEAWALDAAKRGQSFAQICEGLCEWIDEQNVGLRAAELLKKWLEYGLITKYEIVIA